MLPHITTVIRIDLGAGVIEIMVFDERAELRSPIVVRACDDLPREVRMTLPASGAKSAIRALKVGTRGFRKVNADPGASIRLEPPTLGRDSQNEVKHKGATVDPGSHAAASQLIPKGISQREIGAAPKTVIKEVTLDRWTNHARAKDVTEFHAAEKTDVIFRRESERVPK